MKIAISGKGGSGKTTIAATLGYLFSKENRQVFMIDADPDGNLGLASGFTDEELSKVTPLVEMKELIAERTEISSGGYFKLKPDVADIPERFSLKKDNLRLLVLGGIKKGGSGCYCPENAFLKSVLRELLSSKEQVVILDMPAGIEHLSRATAESVDMLLIVVEPTLKGVQTAKRIQKLSTDIKIKNVYFVGNKITSRADREFLEQELGAVEHQFDTLEHQFGVVEQEFSTVDSNEKFKGFIRYDASIINAEQKGIPVYDASENILREVSLLKEGLL